MTKENHFKGSKILADISRLRSEIKSLKLDTHKNIVQLVVYNNIEDMQRKFFSESFNFKHDDLLILGKAIAEMIAVRDKQIEELEKLFERL